MTPYDYAHNNKDEKMMKLLKEHRTEEKGNTYISFI